MQTLIAILALLPQSADEALARKCDSQIPWITDAVELEDGTTNPPPASANSRMELLERAKALARERNRLVLWYCPRVPGTHMMRAACLDTYAKVAFFTDPGVVDLVRAKFVPLRMVCDDAVSAAVGLRKPQFIEPGFVFLTPKGDIVHTLDRIRTFNAEWLRAALVGVLRANASYNAPAGESVDDLIRGGDDEKAMGRATPDQKAVLYRHAGRHRDVLGLDCAPIHHGLALLSLGEFDAARKVLEPLESAEALYHLAAIDAWTGKDPDGALQRVTKRFPESPWAWRAAANRVPARDGLGCGPMKRLLEDFFAPPSLGLVGTTNVPAREPEAAGRRAVEFLLRAQREDGSWSDARYSYGWAKYMIVRRIKEGLLDPSYVSWPDTTHHPNVYMAITALAATALAEWRDEAPERVDRALLRAEFYLADDARIAPGRCEECYAEMSRLLYFATKRDVPQMNRLVARLGRLQDADGFWGHEYPSAFATAAVVHTLQFARSAGADVPAILLDRGGAALRKTRREGGAQDYRHEAGKPASSEKNSASRTAISELALYELGRGSLGNVAAGVDVYWKHTGRLEAIRVCDNHADEELAGFMYFYALFYTVEAARALPEPARKEHLAKFRDLILSLPEADGSFVDSHEMGKSYGTAMGLLILNRVGRESLAVLTPDDQPRKMLNTYLVARSEKFFAERRAALETLKSPEDVRRRQEGLRAKFLETLGGFPERTPLNARTTGVLRREGYRVEKVIYEARPGHHVTANLYLPEGKGPFPAILFPLGHYDNPKPAEEYQRACILLAKNGLAALAYDPIGQGERYQTLGPDGKPRARGTSEHTLVDVGGLLVGTCAAQYFLWEGIRGLDYLCERPEIDPRRLGCMGNSGGGTMTAYLMAIDERVACAVPNCFITSMEKLYTTVGPQDGEANLHGLVAAGFGHSDFCVLRAPRPTQLSCPSRDYYDIEGAWATFREAKRVYGVLGHAERMDLFEWDEKHSIARPFREAGVRWMRRWLLGVDDAPVEGEFPVEKPEDLQCTRTGQVLKDFRERTPYDFTADLEKELASKRVRKTADDLRAEVRRRTGAEPSVAAAKVRSERSELARDGYRIRKVVYETEPGIQVPGLVFVPNEPKDSARVLYVHGGGKSAEARPGGAIERWVRAGHEVTAVDLRGMGETEPQPPHRGLLNFVKADWKEAYMALNLGRPLLGQRVRDVLAVAAALNEDGSGVHLVGVGAAAPVALHAALLDGVVRHLTLEEMVASWSTVARTAITWNQLTNVVPGVLGSYDLPDLAAALAPLKLEIRTPTDPAGKPIPPADVEAAYATVRSAYAEKGAAGSLVLR